MSSSSPQPPYPQDRPAGAPWSTAPTGPTGATGGAGGGDRIQFVPGATVAEHPQATLAFVLGLLSVLGLLILGPFGWYYGRKVVREIDRDPRPFTNRGLAVAGMWLGVVGTAFLAFVTGVLVLGIGLAVVAAGR